MQFSIEREEIVKHLTIVCGVVERRHTSPILSNVLLSVADSRLLLSTTDLEIGINTTLEVQRAEVGKTTVSAKKLLDISRALPPRAVLDVHYKGERLRVYSDRSRFMLSTLPAEDFPGTKGVDEIAKLELTQAELKQLLHKTVFCMAHQDVRYYLNGLLLELDQETETVRTVATDGHRLALAALKKESLGEGRVIQSIVPRKAVSELVRLLEDSDDPVQLKFGTNQIDVEFQGLSFTSKLIDGQFPDYQRVIPVGSEKQLIAAREPLRQTLARVNILTSDKHRGVRLHLGASKLYASVTNPEQESAEEELAIDYQGEEFEIAFNNSYLIDALNAIDTDQVRLEFTNVNSSCLISPVGESEGKYVVMPVRL